LDAAVPAAFLALLAPRLRERQGFGIALAGGLLALAAVPLTRPGVPVLIAGLAVVPLLVRR
ncbi:MAG: branched-chain amino acid permease, partial [Frankiales bacterium]|nr:branched-chain amino acid permease [Frankiales bacterium]